MGFDSNRLGRIGDWMQSYVDRNRFAGCSVLVTQAGKEVYFNATGTRDVETGKPFERDTIARIYSMTKPITSVAIMMLAERGLFHLDAPVSDFIPAFARMECLIPGATSIDQTEPCETPTLHHLLTHTSGLSYPFNPGVLAKAMEEHDILFRADQGSLEAMTDRVAALPLAFHPGSRWEYSVSIDVLGRVVEIVSGKTLEQFFIDEILGPLGMDETRFSVPQGAQDRFAALYTPLAGSAYALNEAKPAEPTLRCVDRPEKSPFLNAEMHSGGGGLVGTIDDYLKFTEMLRTGGAGLLSPKTLSFMMRNHLPGDIASMGPASFAEQPMEGMGFGLGGAVVLNAGRVRVPSSTGDFSWGGMASTFFWVDPVLDLSVVFFTQLAPSSSYPARPQLKALIHGAMT
ncbi:serine hydrolase domain-containing protein [Roseobacter sp. GAI101]|uniref:serine hydrolase domain-containing protein n=1 Tax=Roseobacter sp. (strain GAI101) TaxID=391589 RepID=UPI0001872615|nr:serine hydrolase domain-containing protein [Roseobacter sp. GAI101]EEB82886.1 beta-lactamase [Roseobacter sp. GAI101]